MTEKYHLIYQSKQKTITFHNKIQKSLLQGGNAINIIALNIF